MSSTSHMNTSTAMTEQQPPRGRSSRPAHPGSGTKIAATGLSAALAIGLVATLAHAGAPSAGKPALDDVADTRPSPSASSIVEISIPMPPPVNQPTRAIGSQTKQVVVPKAKPAPAPQPAKKRATRTKQSG